MKKILILLVISLFGCTSFEYENPLDKDSDAFQKELVADDNGDGILNYQEDDDGDGIKNYRDEDSKYNSDYFIKKEDEIVVAKEDINNSNDGNLDVSFNVERGGVKFAKVFNKLTFDIHYKSNGEIIKVDFDFDNDGKFEEGYKTKLDNRSHTYTTKGIKTAIIKVVDKYGNIAKDTAKVLIYDQDSDEGLGKPIIKLKGDSLVELSEGEQYEDPGFTVEDDIFTNNELAEFVDVDVDDDLVYAKKGEYKIVYTIYDPAGNKTVSERIITIK